MRVAPLFGFPRRSRSGGRRCVFVRADHKTGAVSVIKTGAFAVVLDRR
jgi:hypothetical protein